MSIDSITATLDRLKKVDGVITILMVDRDGLLIAKGSGQETSSTEHLASLFARAIHSFERSGQQSGRQNDDVIEQLIIERTGEERMMMFVTEAFILAVVTAGPCNVGLIRMEMRDTIGLLTPLLGL
ncbi:MAG: roadblock/LC7 domain-containing protein [Candidatus Sericytochromatia bacterium]|nr:roadblock/LC7 domain-containing protein [Candidatus Sericytochromatia bacterium]